MTAQTEIEAVAKEVITSLSNHSQIPTFSSRPAGLALAQAYRVTPLLRAAFEAYGVSAADAGPPDATVMMTRRSTALIEG